MPLPCVLDLPPSPLCRLCVMFLTRVPSGSGTSKHSKSVSPSDSPRSAEKDKSKSSKSNSKEKSDLAKADKTSGGKKVKRERHTHTHTHTHTPASPPRVLVSHTAPSTAAMFLSWCKQHWLIKNKKDGCQSGTTAHEPQWGESGNRGGFAVKCLTNHWVRFMSRVEIEFSY